MRGAQVVASHMDITIEIQVDRELSEMYRQSTILSQSVVSMEPVYGNDLLTGTNYSFDMMQRGKSEAVIPIGHENNTDQDAANHRSAKKPCLTYCIFKTPIIHHAAMEQQ